MTMLLLLDGHGAKCKKGSTKKVLDHKLNSKTALKVSLIVLQIIDRQAFM